MAVIIEYSYDFNNQSVTVTIAPDSGKIDLNIGDRDWLYAVLAHYGTAPEMAAGIVDAVVEARGSPSQQFRTVADIQSIEGLSFPSYRCIANVLTGYSRRPSVDIEAADKILVAAVKRAQAQNLGSTSRASESMTDGKQRSVLEQGPSTLVSHLRLPQRRIRGTP